MAKFLTLSLLIIKPYFGILTDVLRLGAHPPPPSTLPRAPRSRTPMISLDLVKTSTIKGRHVVATPADMQT